MNGERVPFYTWVCVRCGARWQPIAADQDPSGHPQDQKPLQTVIVEPPPSSSGNKALVPVAGSRPDVPIKSEGRMRPSAGARPSSGAQTPDVMMIHSNGEDGL